MTILGADWGPFSGPGEARDRLCRAIDAATGSGVGVVWAANDVVHPLRAPVRDGAGTGEIAIFAWTRQPPPPPKPPSGAWEKTKAFIRSVLEQEGRSQMMEAQANMAMGQAIVGGVKQIFGRHQDDAAGVALDVLCIALSLALIPTGIGALGVIGLIGGSVLLVTDGYAYGQEMSGDEEGAEATKKKTEVLRIVATVATLPDLAYGGLKAVREFQEIRELRALDRTTASAATSLAERTARAARAEKLGQIAERANLRAKIRSEQIAAMLKLEFTPRVAGSASVSLLLREEITSDESLLHQVMARLQVHTGVVHR